MRTGLLPRFPLLPVAVALLALPGLNACSSHQPGPAPASHPVPAAPPTKVARGSDESSAREAGAALDAWHDAAARSDEEAYFALFDREGVFLGTDVTERWDHDAFRAYAHKPFSSGRGWNFKATRRALRISSDGDLAFFDEDLTSPKFPPTRGSGVLVRRGEGWRVLQYVLSMTIPNDRFDAVKEDAAARVALTPEGTLSALAWLGGTWASDDRAVELTWSQARAETMAGTLRVVAVAKGDGAGRTQSIDALRIEVGEKATTYTADRKGGATVRYEMEKPAGGSPSAPDKAPPDKARAKEKESDKEKKGARVSFVDVLNQAKLTFSRDGDDLRIVVERKGKIEETTLLRRAVIVGH